MKVYKGMKNRIKRAALLSTLTTWAVVLAIALLCVLTGCAAVQDKAPTQEATAKTDTDAKEAEVPSLRERIEAERREAEAKMLQQANRIEGCTITYYCCELRPHICGTGNGITASGAPVQAGVSCAVDPVLIPLGSKVMVDYGDGVLHHYIAQDVGAWVNGGHIDLAVATHEEALRMGRKTATVYWLEG